MRRAIVLTLVLALASAVARPAFAHGFGQSYELGLWLYLYGAAAAVLASFVSISLFAGRSATGEPYPRFDLLRIAPLRAVLTSRAFLLGLRLLSVAHFLLVIFGGFLGKQAENKLRPDFRLGYPVGRPELLHSLFG